MAGISLKNIKKVYPGGVEVINNLNLEIKDKEFLILVGPSGCGKSTTLRMIAGLEEITDGELYIGDRLVNDVPAKDRDIAMVFQSYALYPHMTVYKNMAFGLSLRKMPKDEIDKKVREAARILDLETLLDRKPKALSGGQRQRVALGRAMVRDPAVFLLDEPLSNLDAKLRAQMRVELIELHKKLGTTFVYVTHDQTEAMSMADTIVLMKDGYIVQQSSPRELYNNPSCVYAAQFIGTPQMNVLRDVLPDGKMLGFRPEKLYFGEMNVPHISISVRIATKEMLGSEIIYSLNSRYGTLMAKTDWEKETGEEVKIQVPFSAMYLFGADEKRIELDDGELEMIRTAFAE